MPPRGGSLVDHRMTATTDLRFGFASNRTVMFVMCEYRDYRRGQILRKPPFTSSPRGACCLSCTLRLHLFCISASFCSFILSQPPPKSMPPVSNPKPETAAQAHDDISRSNCGPLGEGKARPFPSRWVGLDVLTNERIGILFANHKL